MAHSKLAPEPAPLSALPAPAVSYVTPSTTAKTVAPLAYPAPASVPSQYNYVYSVADSITGDFKSQFETRRGGKVQGSYYSLIDPDGIRRVVEYTAGPDIGFKELTAGFPSSASLPLY